jgi:hypothetical protein
MADPNEKQLLAHALSLLAVLLTASGIFVTTVSLESKRPADSERAKILHAGRQDVEARLWQDPFSAMRGISADSANARCAQAHGDADHHPDKLSNLISRRAKREAITVLPVMVPGGPYFENSESRRRARYAVVMALLNSGWEPLDEDKLGYIWTFESCTADRWKRSAPEMLPWEWFSRRPAHKPAEGLLVLWVDDDAVSRHPLRGVNAIIKRLTPKPRPESERAPAHTCPLPWCATRVIGPWTSDGMRGLARELVDDLGGDIVDLPEPTPGPGWLRFYSAGATAAIDDSFMRAAIGNRRADSPIVTQVRELLNARLLRLTTTDDELARALVNELKLRLVDPHPFWRLIHRGNAEARALCEATIVIVAERESIYGRLFAKAFEDHEAFEDHKAPHCGPLRVVTKSYLRGLDGVLPERTGEPVPGGQSQNGSAQTNGVALLKQAARERAEGRSQYDYLRRLADDLATLDARERSDGRTVRAIGVLGNDTYDKILVLQALRDGFPKAVFFTADLDARMVDADVNKWTRNLVVASAYGLTLNPDIQGAAPPFRDSYQTGLYLATLVALDPDAQSRRTGNFANWFTPQMFEIGRTRAVALSPAAHAPCVKGDGVSTVDPVECPNVHRLEEWEWSRFPWPPLRVWLALLMASAFTAMLWWQTCGVSRQCASTLAVLGRVAVPLSVFGVWFGARIWLDVSTYKGEPFALFQGVSLWPTVLLRLVVLTVIAYLLCYCWWRLSREIKDLESAFALPAANADPHSRLTLQEQKHWPAWVTRIGAINILVVLCSLLGVGLLWLDWRDLPHRGVFSAWPIFLPVIAGGLWSRLQKPSRDIKALGTALELPAANTDAHPWVALAKEMHWFTRARRIGVISILFFFLGIGLLLLDWPNSPHRGVFSAWSDHITFLLVLFFLAALLFAFLDSSSVVTRFVEQLASRMETSEITELLDRRHIRMDGPVTRLDAWFRLVVRLGVALNHLVYLPFIALLLVISTSAGVFDIWTLPLAYVLLFVLAAALAVVYVARFRRRAAELRKTITDKLNIWIERYELDVDRTSPRPWDGGLPPQARVRHLKSIRDEVLAERDGPFRPIGEDPIVRAILLLFGGAGAITTATFLLPGL